MLTTNAVVIAGYYGFGNAGDELILQALVQRLRTEDPRVLITVFSRDPLGTRKAFGVKSVSRWRPWAWIWPLLRANRFLLGGGGLLQERTGPWNHAYYLSLVLIAKVFRCRTEVVALGVDPTRGPWNRWWTAFVLNWAADRVSVRDGASKEALQEAGVDGPIAVVTDPVFELPVPLSPHERSGIALALSPSRVNPKWDDELVAFCAKLREAHIGPIDLLVFYPNEDFSFCQRLAQRTEVIREVRVWKNPIDLLDWIPQYQGVVGTRFHALVLAASSRTPFIGWGPQMKVAALCKQWKRPYANTDESWDLEEQCRQVSSLYKSGNKSVILETRLS